MTGELKSKAPPEAEDRDKRERMRQDKALDEALKSTFPASDPISIEQPASPDPKRPKVISTVRARQGVTGHNVRYVLTFGLTGAVIALVLLYIFYFYVI